METTTLIGKIESLFAPLSAYSRGIGATAAIIVIGGSVAWSEQISQPVQRPGKVVVTYWEKWSDFEADAMRQVVNDFNNSQDKIYVDYLSVSGVDQKTLLATASGTPPDLAGLFGTNVALYAYYDSVTDLTDMANQAGITRDKFIPVFYDMGTIDGKLYALPTTPATVALHYNRRMMKERGLDPNKPPETLDDLDAMDSKMIVKKDGKVISNGFLPSEPGWWPWVWPYYFGGSLYDPSTKTVTADRPENLEAYKWMAGYAKRMGGGQAVKSYKDGFGQFNTFQNAFISGKVGSELQGVWMANFIQKYNPDFDWAAAPFPYPKNKPELKNTAMVDLDIITIPRGAKHPKEAFEFLKYLMSQKPMEKLCLLQKKFSPLAEQSPYFEVGHPNPFIHLFRQMAFQKNVIIPPKTPIWAEYQAEIQTQVDAMNNSDKDPATALKQLQVKAQALQDDVNLDLDLRRKAGLIK